MSTGAGVLDYVAAWYRKAADYMAENPAIEAAFVSTNSITQGEQVGILWPDLFRRGVKIHFAHRTFQWSSEARGKAAVHCVIIGFGLHDIAEKWLFDYETQKSEPHAVRATNINPYLIDGPNVVLVNRREPICSVPEIREGSDLIDDGHLLLSPKERDELLLAYPEGAIWVRPFVWGEGFINSERRYCLWLAGVSPESLRKAPSVVARVQAVSEFRRNSQREATKKLAALPALFGEIRQPKNEYLMMPKTSSERRTYTPIGFLSPDNIINNTSLFVDGAKPYHFGILSSAMHMAWVRAVCGRLKSDYRYSAGIVYNNFPWPQSPSGKQKQTIEAAAQAVLEARAKYPGSSLADLYDPLTMPPELVQAHRKLDAAVDAAYARRKFSGDSDRLAFLFELYQQLVSPLVAKKNLRRKSAR